jgi:integrase
MRFTDAKLRALKAKADRYEEVEAGATGLAVRVSVRGVRSFQYLYRFDGKPRRLTLGIYRDIAVADVGGVGHDRRGLPYLTLADARVRLAEARRLRDSGTDPATVAVMQHRAERKTKTIGELIDLYLAKYARPHKKSASQDERMLNKDVRPGLGDRKLSSVTRRDLIALLDDVATRAPVTANRLQQVVRKMFRWAIRQGIIEHSPANEIDPPGGREAPRDRALSDGEIAEVWRAAGKLEAPYRQFVQLLMVLGQRRGEVAGMRRDELSDDRALWTIGRARMKGALPHEVPLPAMARAILQSLPEPGEGKPQSPYVFESRRREGQPIGAFQEIKEALDRHVLDARREALHLAGGDPAEVQPMTHWTMHDLRRTMRSNLSKLRLDPEICERVLAHIPAGIRRTYDVHQYRDEKREVLNAWAARLQRIISAKPTAGGKVVPLRPAAS